MVIYQDTANILTSRENPLMETNDSLTIDFIKTIPENNNYQGGVKDFGKFSEGSCFEIYTVQPSAFFIMTSKDTEPSTGRDKTWLFCTDKDQDKANIMNILIKLKLKKQHKLGVYITTQAIKKGSSGTLTDIVNNGSKAMDPEKLNDPNKAPEDGYWIILQNWTPCTLKCGGGLQYLQLMCFPPKKGGKPCEGEAIRTHPCNKQACPQINQIAAILPQTANPTTKMEKPIVKMMAISKRPQRYDKCYLKDSDALMVKSDSSTASMEILPKIPIRLVMNNKSISVYGDEELSTNLMTFMLDQTVFARVKDEPRCFILNGLNLRAQFCQLDSATTLFVEEWDYDFNLFKNQCREKRGRIQLKISEEKGLEKEFQARINNVRLDIVHKKASRIKDQAQTAEQIKLTKKVEQTQAMTLVALQKELKMEGMLEKEEEDREMEERVSLTLQIESEKKKKDCLIKSIKEKQLEDQYNVEKSNAENAIEKIKEDAKKTILVQRVAIKKKLAMMRKKNNRRTQALQGEMTAIRTETAEAVSKVSKLGNIKSCFNSSLLNETTSQIEEYCQINFSGNLNKFAECKNPETFCFVCCESEFGDIHVAEREKCYRDVCENTKSAALPITLA